MTERNKMLKVKYNADYLDNENLTTQERKLLYKQTIFQIWNKENLTFVEKVKASKKLSSPIGWMQSANISINDNLLHVTLYAEIAISQAKKSLTIDEITQNIINEVEGLVCDKVNIDYYLVQEVNRRMIELDSKITTLLKMENCKPQQKSQKRKQSAIKKLLSQM